MLKSLLRNNIFKAAISDMESQGIHFSSYPVVGALPYAVISGRTNSRWWLVPLQNRHVAASGLALFQPLLPSARIMKAAVVVLSMLGLSRFWARNRVYIFGVPDLGRYFPDVTGHAFAYFTGTDSPHRKVAVQIMDSHGKLLGFAKLSRNPTVAALLLHEAAMLQRVQALHLKSAYTPVVHFSGKSNDAILLVTDTLKTASTRSVTTFTGAHRAFLKELELVTACAEPRSVEVLAAAFSERIHLVASRLDGCWRHRLESTVARLESYQGLALATGLSHGDFTPWNTFIVRGRLYVFDWEYASEATPFSNDILHFVLNQPGSIALRPQQKLEVGYEALKVFWKNEAENNLQVRLMIYILTQTLRQIERLPVPDNLYQFSGWDGEADQAVMLDLLLARKIESN